MPTSAKSSTSSTSSTSSISSPPTPCRIICLLPSVTEIVFALGAGKHVVGVTHECDHPPIVKTLPKCTASLLPPNLSACEIDEAVTKSLTQDEHSIYRLREEEIQELNPTTIITQSLCAVCAVPETKVSEFISCKLAFNQCKIIKSDPHNIEDELFESILTIGKQIKYEQNAKELIQSLKNRLTSCHNQISNISFKPNVLVLEWPDPPFAPGHWVPQQIQMAGGTCVLGIANQPSFRCQWSQLFDLSSSLDFIICAFCGYDLHENERQIDLISSNKDWIEFSKNNHNIFATNANAYFSRPGNRLIDGVELLSYILHNVQQYKPTERGQASKLTNGKWIDLYDH